MWYQNIDKIEFLKILYSQIPELDGVRIENVLIMRGGTIFRLSFDMPSFPTHLPPKWSSSLYSKIHVTVDLFDVHNISISYESTNMENIISDIRIDKINNNLELKLNGDINVKVIASNGLIQSITPY